MVAEEQAAARRSALEQALAEATALRAQGLFFDALQKWKRFLRHKWPRPVNRPYQLIGRSHSEGSGVCPACLAELHEFIRRTKDLLAQGRLDEAKTLLQAPLPSIKDHPEVTQLRSVAELELKRQAQREAAREKALTQGTVLPR